MTGDRFMIWTDDPRPVALEAAGEAREFAVTIIRPGTSQNGMVYSPAVLAAAVPKFEAAAAFADHPNAIDATRAGGRSLRDLVGVFHSVAADDAGAIRATLRVSPSAAWAADLIAGYIADRDAGRPVPPIGISADLLVTRRALSAAEGGRVAGTRPEGANRRRARFEITGVEAVNSADLVFRPSAGGTFDRILNAQEEEGEMPEETITIVEDTSEETPAPAAAVEATGHAAAGAPHSPIRGMGAPRAQVGRSSLQQFQTALDILFGVDVPESQRNVHRLSGIREAYLALTGDYEFSGRRDPERATVVVREANETLLAQMDSVVAAAASKKLTQDYKAQPKWWEPLAVKTSSRDMRLQTRVLLNDFGALAAVAENGAYANVAWGDAAETFSITKKGNLVYVSMEAIVNDDVHAFTRLPKKLATAATVTINETLAALWTAGAGAGPNMADASPVFGVGRGNYATDALAEASLGTGITAMYKFTNSATKRLGIRPRFLLIPPDLEWTARKLCLSVLLPGSANNDINPYYRMVEPLVVPNWTDANNWYLHADPNLVEGIEVCFLNGHEAPEILVADDQRAGYTFTNDAIVWKVRWIYGAGWVDWRAGYGGVVA